MGNGIRRKFHRESHTAADLPDSTVLISDGDDEHSESGLFVKSPNLKTPNTEHSDTDDHNNNNDDDEEDEG